MISNHATGEFLLLVKIIVHAHNYETGPLSVWERARVRVRRIAINNNLISFFPSALALPLTPALSQREREFLNVLLERFSVLLSGFPYFPQFYGLLTKLIDTLQPSTDRIPI